MATFKSGNCFSDLFRPPDVNPRCSCHNQLVHPVVVWWFGLMRWNGASLWKESLSEGHFGFQNAEFATELVTNVTTGETHRNKSIPSLPFFTFSGWKNCWGWNCWCWKGHFPPQKPPEVNGPLLSPGPLPTTWGLGCGAFSAWALCGEAQTVFGPWTLWSGRRDCKLIHWFPLI